MVRAGKDTDLDDNEKYRVCNTMATKIKSQKFKRGQSTNKKRSREPSSVDTIYSAQELLYHCRNKTRNMSLEEIVRKTKRVKLIFVNENMIEARMYINMRFRQSTIVKRVDDINGKTNSIKKPFKDLVMNERTNQIHGLDKDILAYCVEKDILREKVIIYL